MSSQHVRENKMFSNGQHTTKEKIILLRVSYCPLLNTIYPMYVYIIFLPTPDPTLPKAPPHMTCEVENNCSILCLAFKENEKIEVEHLSNILIEVIQFGLGL